MPLGSVALSSIEFADERAFKETLYFFAMSHKDNGSLTKDTITEERFWGVYSVSLQRVIISESFISLQRAEIRIDILISINILRLLVSTVSNLIVGNNMPFNNHSLFYIYTLFYLL